MQQDKESEFNDACEMMFEFFYNYKFDYSRSYLSLVRELLDDFERAMDGREVEYNKWQEEIQEEDLEEEPTELAQQLTSQDEMSPDLKLL